MAGWIETLVAYSYPGFFLIGLTSSSTIFLPLPIYSVVFFSASLGLNPLIVGIVTGLGAAIGEITGYFIGEGSRVMLLKKYEKRKIFKFVQKNFEKYGFIIILVGAFLPFPFDIIGIIAGVNNYNVRKFLIATSIGKILKMVLIAYAGVYTLPFIEEVFLKWEIL